MDPRLLVTILTLVFVGLSVPAQAKASKQKRPAPDRRAELVIDATTGRILHEVNGTATRHPASLTKMMTLYLTFQALEAGRLRLDTPLPVSKTAAAQPASKLGLRVGQTIRVQDAILALVTESANDASVVLAEAIGGSVRGFASMMNLQAKALGMRQTVFQNPNGLPDPNQITSARDMAMLGYALIQHYPGFYPFFSRRTFEYKGVIHDNHNHLMKQYPGMDGIKTGYIRASGFNLVASAQRGETRLIGVVFGGSSTASRNETMRRLLDAGFGAIRGTDSALAELPLPTKTPSSSTEPRVRRKSAGGRYIYTTPNTTTPVTAPTPPSSPFGPPTPPPGQRPASEDSAGGWSIQVGAYSDIDTAQKALRTMALSLSSMLSGTEQSLQKLTMSDGSVVYRARFTGLEQITARQACSSLIQQGHGCMVVTGP